MRKFAPLLVAIAIAAYAIHGLIGEELVMPYEWWSGSAKHTRLLHLRGMWAIGGSVCLLLGAAGFAILSYGTISAGPGAKRGKQPYRNPAAVLIAVGCVFFLGVTMLTQWFIP